jgi:hypothetical protein
VPGGLALAVALDRRRGQFHDPGAAGPGVLDVIGSFLGPDLPAGVTPVASLLIRCSKRDPALSLELTADLPVERRLVGFDGQGDVGSPFDAPAKKSWVVCNASAWISFPSRSIVPSSSYCFAEACG